MMDEIYDRSYQNGRADLNAGIHSATVRFIRAVDNAFKVLQRIEYDAPWAARKTRRARAH